MTKRLILILCIIGGFFAMISTTHALANSFAPIIAETDTTRSSEQPDTMTLEKPLDPPSAYFPAIYIQSRTLPWPRLPLRTPAPLTKTAADGTTCVVPVPNMVITTDTTLCPGTHTNATPASNFINIEADNVTLDCDGAILEDVTTQHLTDGIHVRPQYSNVTIQNCILKNMFIGIYTGDGFGTSSTSTNITIANNTFINEFKYWTNIFLNNVTSAEVTGNIRDESTSDPASWLDSHFLNVWKGGYHNIHDNTVANHVGIHLTWGTHDNYVHHNTIHKSGNANHSGIIGGGIVMDRNAHYNIIDANYFQTTASISILRGVVLHGFTTDDVLTADPEFIRGAHDNTIVDNVFDATNGSLSTAIIILTDAHDNTITGNSLVGDVFLAVFSEPGYTEESVTRTYWPPHDNTITNNLFGNPLTSESSTFNTISIVEGVYNYTISGNTIDNCYYGIRAPVSYNPDSPPTDTVRNITITNNTITNCQVGIVFTDKTVVSGERGWRIQHNYFAHIVELAINLHDSTNDHIISENTLIDSTINGGNYPIYGAQNQILDHAGRGNYYDTYDEPAEGCTDTDQNGICDAPRVFWENSVNTIIDRFPLASPTICISNCPPTISPIAPVTANEQDIAIITIDAADPNNDALTYWVDDDRFESFDGCWPGRHAFAWHTDPNSAGTYTVDTVVSDGEFEVRRPVTVTVRNTCHIDKWGAVQCNNSRNPVACY